MEAFKIFGIIGLILISIGVILQGRKHRNILFMIGGFFLVIYSFMIQDIIFVILQIIFILSALLSIFRKRKAFK